MKPYYQIAFFFAITQLLGIFSGAILLQKALQSEEIQQLAVAPLPKEEPANALIYIAYILFGAAAIILLARFYRGLLLFQLIEMSVIVSASSIVFFAFFLFAGFDLWSSIASAGVLGCALGVAKFFWQQFQNIAAVVSSAGVGALFGFSLGFLPAVLFVILLAIYDYIAVFKTRHMIEMARELSSRQLSFTVSAKKVPLRKPKETPKEYAERVRKEGERLDLGTGDLAVPAMLSVSAYSLGANGIIYSLAIAAGSTVALLFLLRFVSRQRVFLPALPPICLGGMLALLAVKLLGL
ncbi:MAG: presenilin family intramembrane aspartyl protease [Candidatus Micrarchaeota archaeon]|nr:presenilin family intramembrane aspartyl protease [Candidatus Micrarchaeota archaeon]